MPNQPDQRCHNCKFFDRGASGCPVCRRYPPGSDGWPSVDPNDWCGEFRADAALRDQQRKDFQQRVAEVKTEAEAEYWRKIAEGDS